MHLNAILEKLGVTHDLGWWSIGKPMADFLFALSLIELFSLSRFWSYEAKCVQLVCFHTGRPLCTQILTGQGRPHQPFLATRDTGLPDGEGRIGTSLFVPSFWHAECDGQTDGYAVAYSACKANFAARCKSDSAIRSCTWARFLWINLCRQLMNMLTRCGWYL